MNKQSLLILEKKMEQKNIRREKKKKTKMKVSSAGVKKLQKIIIDKKLK